ncbi:MAG TPA: hypothetical protein VGG99_08685 [Acetobacteraceae bacterium]|jgi:hypothetical protein
MIRVVAWLGFGLLVGAAAPSLPLPLPPAPPADLAIGEPAPIPDSDLLPPDAGASPGTQVNLHLFTMREYGNGLAYIPGSAYESPEERKAMQTPGLTVSVPVR